MPPRHSQANCYGWHTDISHTISLMASWSTRNPAIVLYFEPREPEEGEHALCCCTDASFSPYGERSFTGIAILYKGCLLSWKAAKQALVTLSSSEAELVSATEGVIQSMGLRSLLAEATAQRELPICLKVDNTSALLLIQGKGANRTRHLRVRCHFVREMVQNGEVVLQHLPGLQQVADALTKVLPGQRLEYLRYLLGLRRFQDSPPPASAPADLHGGEAPDEPEDPLVARVAPDGGVEPSTTLVPSGSLGCLDGVRACLSALVLFLQSQPVQGQGEKEKGAGLAVDPPYELIFLTVIAVLAVLALWEGGRSVCRTLCPRARAVTKKEKRLEDLVREAVKRELEGEPVEAEAIAPVSGLCRILLCIASPSRSTSFDSCASAVSACKACSEFPKSRETDGPDLDAAPVTQPVSAAVQPPSGLHRNCIPTSTVMTTIISVVGWCIFLMIVAPWELQGIAKPVFSASTAWRATSVMQLALRWAGEEDYINYSTRYSIRCV